MGQIGRIMTAPPSITWLRITPNNRFVNSLVFALLGTQGTEFTPKNMPQNHSAWERWASGKATSHQEDRISSFTPRYGHSSLPTSEL